MYSLKNDLAQKKKKQALRRLSQSGQKGASPSTSGRTYAAGGGGVRGRRGGGRTGIRGRGRGALAMGTRTTITRHLQQAQKQQQNNPFLVASMSSQNNSQNPFLGGGKVTVTTTTSSSSMQAISSQMAQQQQSSINPFLTSGPVVSASNSSSQPPSYASIVSGGGAATQAQTVGQPPQGPVPTFITHGPNSVQVLPQGHSDINPTSTQTTNQLISASLPPISTSTLLGPPKFQIPINVPQFALNTQGGTSQAPPIAPPPFPQLPSYNQAMSSSTYQPALQMAGATIAPLQSGAGAIPLNMTLHVKGVPDELNNQAFMEKHFSRFGPLKAVECHPQKKYVTVTFRNKESAVKAKREGKILSPKYRPVQMFWQAIPMDKPAQIKQTNQTNAVPPTNTADNQQQQLSDRWKDEGDADSGLEDGAPADNVQEEEGTGVRPSTLLKKPVLKSVRYVAKQNSAKSKLVTRVPAEKNITGISGGAQKVAKKSIWERLGNRAGESSGKQATVGGKGKSKANNDDQEWQPEREDGGERGGRQDEGEGEEEVNNAPIMSRELADLGLKTTGDEMDTIARYVQHPYFLRSLTQSGAYPGPKADDQHVEQQQQPQQKLKITVQKSSRLPQGVDSRQAYVIPNPQLLPPPRPKGTSANDLYESLDARDQDIRKAMVKQTSLTSAKSVVGTCPDMCPEKERYRREDTRRLSWFEVDHSTYEPGNAKVVHSKAIKEYSGSAADKEEPLPHELRPIGVLQMTMDYLVTMVMDQGGDRSGDWYDFVWNRTRAIRKDITLQHLSTYECVELTEKCARFHILCSYLLCEEDMSDFDPKLNNENLNKCLLSLKEFYRDLRHQKGLVCPNEAEFCGYDILLHLTDGDVLNVVGKYSPGVQEKLAVRFAVEAALAVDSNNFVKFFKMVKNTTFLNACIMHGYFTMVRTRALRTMNRAHSVARKSIPFPLSSVARMLAFPNPREAGEFCAEFQLVVSEKAVEFVREFYLQNPAEAIPRKRSPHLVDVKNTKSLGECVNGGPLPPPPIHTPYSSFSPGAQLRSREPSPLPAPPTAPPPQPIYNIIDMATAVNGIVDEVVTNDLRDLVQESFHQLEAIKIKEQASAFICSSLLDGIVLEESRQVARETLLEEADAHRVKEELSLRLLERVLLEVVSSETHLVIHDTYRDCVVEAEAKAAATLSVTSSLVEEGVSECVKALVEEALNEAWKERMEHLEALRISLERKRLLKCWKRWRRMLSVRQHVHKCVAAIPPLPPVVTLPWQLEALLPNEKRRRVESLSLAQNTVAQLLEESREEREKKRREFLSPLDLPSLLQESLLLSRIQDTLASSRSTKHIFWKMAFVFHSQCNLTPNDSRIVEWLYHKLQFQPKGTNDDSTPTSLSPSDSELQTLSLTSNPLLSQAGVGRVSLSVAEGEGSGMSRRLCLAVKGCCDEVLWRKDEALAKELCGTSAIAVFLPTPQQFSDRAAESLIAYVLQVVERVVSKELFPRVPLLILCSNEMEEKFLAMWIQIRMALNTVHHSPFSAINYLLVDLSSTDSSQQSEKQLAQTLCQLAKSSPPQPNLFHQPLREFVEQGLLKHFVSPVVSDGDVRRKACLPSQLPAPIISLYNTVIQHLIETATSDKVRTLNWPVTEFVSSTNFSHGGPPPVHWNSNDYLGRLQNSLSSLLLPPPPTLPQHADWSVQCAQCNDYVRSISLPTDDVMAVIPLTSRVTALLHHAEDHSEFFIPWDQVILVCAEHMVAYLTSDLWVSGFYGNNTTEVFPLPSEWLKAQAETTFNSLAQVTSEGTPGSIRKRRRHRSDPPYAEVTSTPAYSHSPQASLSVGVSPASTLAAAHNNFSYGAEEEELRHKLESSLKKEKALSQSFEAQLQQWLSPSATTSCIATSAPERQPTRGRHSVEPEHSREEGNKVDSSEDSIMKGLQQLRKKIRLAKYLDTKDNIHLHSLMNSPHLTSPQSQS